MKPIIVRNSRIPALLSIVIPVGAITLFPFIIIRGEGDERVINHESIHIAQYAELWVFGFLFLYGLDYLKGLIRYRNKEQAYFRIRFEQEAYQFENDYDYLQNRERNAWRQYEI